LQLNSNIYFKWQPSWMEGGNYGRLLNK